jgi:hypothetical protein
MVQGRSPVTIICIIRGANYIHGQYGPAESNLTIIALDCGKKITVHKEAA